MIEQGMSAPPDVGPNPPGAGLLSALLKGETPTAPSVDPYTDDPALIKVFREFHKLSFDQRWVYERNWWRNLLYALGRQWIFYNQQRGAWQDKRMQRWVPRPVTNKVGESIDTMRAIFQGVELSVKVRPLSDDPQDTRTAETSETMAPALDSEHDMPFRTFESDFWLITTGNSFWHVWFDQRLEHGRLLVPFEKCLACGAVSEPFEIVRAGQTCPKCGQRAFEQAVDPQGNPIGAEYPKGRGATDVCSPFEIGFPSGYTAFDDLPGLIRQRWRAKEYYERYYPDLVKTLKFEKMAGERSLQLLKALASQSDIAGTALGSNTSDAGQGEGLTEYELWLKPTPVYTRGLLCRFVGQEGAEKVLRSDKMPGIPGPLPMSTKQGQPMFPWLHLGYNRFGGRIWARSPVDYVIQKQDQINQLDSLMLLGVQRMSNPVWIEPKGAEVKKFTGEPGLVVKYNPLVAGGNAKPERIEGSQIPSSLLKLREQYIQDFENLLGTQDVLKGSRPSGVSAFSTMQLLVERAQARFGPVLAERGEAYRRWFTMALEIERQFGPMERTWSAMGANRRWTFKTFQNADIQGAIKVLIEDGSQAPKTNLGVRAAIEQLNNLGQLDPNDIDQKMRIYEAFGQTNLLPSLDAARQGVLAEQAAFEEWAMSPGSLPAPMPAAPGMVDPLQGGGQQPQRRYFDDGSQQPPAPAGESQQPPAQGGPVTPMLPPTLEPSPLVLKEWHPDLVHVAEHEKWANSDAARMLFKSRPDMELVFTLHLVEHKQRAAMAQMAQQQAEADAQAGNKRGAGGQRALQNSNQESGKRGANQAPPA